MTETFSNSTIDSFAVTAGLTEGPSAQSSMLEAEFAARVLGLKPGDRVLDLPCGNGRHAFALGKLGCKVMAVDIEPDSIAAAEATAAHPNVSYKLGDILDLRTKPESFDAVVSLFSCLGYFDNDAKDRAMVTYFARWLRPGGRLLLSTANGEAIAQAPQGISRFVSGSCEILRDDQYSPELHCLMRKYTIADRFGGEPRIIVHRRRLYHPEEALTLFATVGLQPLHVFGDYAGGAFDQNLSLHAIYLCHLPV